MIWLFFLILVCVKALEDKYAVVIDAGSTGSRIFIYHYNTLSDGSKIVTSTTGGKVRPGLSSFIDKINVIGDYLMPLLVNSADQIPKDRLADTQLFIKGTAGMRLLSDSNQQQIWDAVYNDLTNVSKCNIPLMFKRENFGSISGHNEAFYAVIASNYIAGRIDADLRCGHIHCSFALSYTDV